MLFFYIEATLEPNGTLSGRRLSQVGLRDIPYGLFTLLTILSDCCRSIQSHSFYVPFFVARADVRPCP